MLKQVVIAHLGRCTRYHKNEYEPYTTRSPCGTEKTNKVRISLTRSNEIEPPMSFERVRKTTERTWSILHFASKYTYNFITTTTPTTTHHAMSTKTKKGLYTLSNEIRLELCRAIALKVFDCVCPRDAMKEKDKNSCMASFLW